MTRTIYFVGAGAIAHHHMEAVAHLPDADELEVAAVDPDPDARADFEAQHPRAVTYEDRDAMLDEPADPDDIVVVAAPPFVHRDATIAALENGRHVLCEKPLAMTREEALEMLATAKANDRILGDCTCRHYGTRGTELVTELLADGAIGEVYHVSWIKRARRGRPGIEYQPESTWFLDSARSGGGIVMDWGPYEFAALGDVLGPNEIEVRDAWLAQPKTDVDPDDLSFDVETHAGASLVYRTDDGAVPVTYERASGTHGSERYIAEIDGLDGAIRWTWTDVGETTVVVARDEDGEVAEETITVEPDETLTPHERPLVFFDRHLRGVEAPILTDERAVFNFLILPTIYDCANADEPRRLRFEEVATEIASTVRN